MGLNTLPRTAGEDAEMAPSSLEKAVIHVEQN